MAEGHCVGRLGRLVAGFGDEAELHAVAVVARQQRGRDNSDVAVRVSTVDDLESFMGQTASVLALVDLGVAKVGHYGVGPAAQRLLPAPPT